MVYITRNEQPRNEKEYIIINNNPTDKKRMVSMTQNIQEATCFKTKGSANHYYNRHKLYQYNFKIEEITNEN